MRLEACDPGGEAVTATGSAIGSLTLLAARTSVLADALDQGATQAFASCFSRAIVTTFTLDELSAPELPADFAVRRDAAAAGC